MFFLFFFSSRRRHTRCGRDWSSDVCSSDLVFEPGDLRIPRVGNLTDLLEGLEPLLELDAEGRVGAVAVEGGAVDAGLAGEGLDVAAAAGWELAAQQQVHDG